MQKCVNLEFILKTLDIQQFKKDFNILTSIEMQLKYNISEYNYFKLVQYLNIHKRLNTYTLEELCKILPKKTYIELCKKYTDSEIIQMYNITKYQLHSLKMHYNLISRKPPQTYLEFKNSIDITAFIDYVASGGTNYAEWLQTKNNRFINKLLKELNLKRRRGIQEILDTINIERFSKDFRICSLQDLAIKYNICINTVKKLQRKLNIEPHSTSEIFSIRECNEIAKQQFCGTVQEFRTKKAYKVADSKKKLGTINSSDIESFFVTELTKLYSKENVLTQVKSEKYPYHCDIYVKLFDLYIEVNGHFSHGFHPFNPQDPKDIKQLEIIKQKQKYYISSTGKLKKNAYFTWERVWTKRDPMKLNKAFENKLKYILVYMESNHSLSVYLVNIGLTYFNSIFETICKNSKYKIDKIQCLTV